LLAHEGLIDRGGSSVASVRNRVREDAGVGKSKERIEEQELQTVGEPHQGDPLLASTEGEGTQEEDKRLGAGNEPELEPPEPEPPPKDLSSKRDDPGRDLKAVKADDAATPIWLWNDAIRAGLAVDPSVRRYNEVHVDKALATLRNFLLCRVSRLGVTRSYFCYIHNEYPELHVPERTEVRCETYLREGREPGDAPIPSVRYRWRPKFG
jgi:hypothetical protein